MAAAVLMGAEQESCSSEPTAEENRSGEGGETVEKGQTLDVEGIRFRVTSVKKRTDNGDPLGDTKPQGVFVVVTVNITNGRDAPEDLSPDFSFITRAGKKYATSDDAPLDTITDSLDTLQPDIGVKRQLWYDLPPGKVAGGKLRIDEGSITSDAVGFIKLG